MIQHTKNAKFIVRTTLFSLNILFPYLSLRVLAEDLQLGRAETQQVALELHLGNLSGRADGLQAQCPLFVEEQQDAHLVQRHVQILLAGLEVRLPKRNNRRTG